MSTLLSFSQWIQTNPKPLLHLTDGNQTEAEDVRQNALVNMHKALNQKSFYEEKWSRMYRIYSRWARLDQIVDQKKTAAREKKAAESLYELQQDQPLIMRFEEALDELPYQIRTLMMMHVKDELTGQEIAKLTGMKLSTVYKLLVEGKKLVKAALLHESMVQHPLRSRVFEELLNLHWSDLNKILESRSLHHRGTGNIWSKQLPDGLVMLLEPDSSQHGFPGDGLTPLLNFLKSLPDSEDLNQKEESDGAFQIEVDPGEATPEEIQSVFDQISELYEMLGGSGLNFRRLSEGTPEAA